jgi:isoquinoline 1-oxidoreductase alpha subunit
MATLRINGQTHEVNVPDDMSLLWVLRDVVGLTGTKFGCRLRGLRHCHPRRKAPWRQPRGIAQCGACTVHVDGRAVRSCVLPVANVGNREITTIEAVGKTPSGQKVQQAWIDIDVVQCGYCQSGQIMSAAALLAANLKPSDVEIDAAMSGNICRCGTYPQIRAAIRQAGTYA